ncbi:MAG: hypothetical protein AAGF81_10435 [Pseudomonadota bacterium]
MTRFLAIGLAVLVFVAEAVAESRHVLKGRIIRALAIEPGNPDHILVGQKAGKPGSGLVFKSLDGGKSWRTQNGNAPLAPAAADVQAVAALSRTALLAGTWKYGAFASRNGGGTFAALAGALGTDVRDFALSGGTAYAATATKGVFESRDNGISWTRIGGRALPFLWSLTSGPDALYASSPQEGVFALQDGAWQHIFDQDKIYAAAAPAEPEGEIALAGETGLYLGRGGNWRKLVTGEKFAEVLAAPNGALLAGSWQDGLAVITPSGKVSRRILRGKAVIHLKIAGSFLYAGTWGDGLHILPLSEILPKTP